MDTIEEPMDSFQSRLRTAMQMRNMSVNTLSKKSGISQNTIYIYLNPEKYHRESCPGSNNLEAMAEALDVSMDWLWGRPVALMSWIPVSERLPEDMQFVLLTVRRLKNEYNSGPFISVGYIGWNQQHWWCAHDGDCEISKVEVLAWMPLPEAYKPNKK